MSKYSDITWKLAKNIPGSGIALDAAERIGSNETVRTAVSHVGGAAIAAKTGGAVSHGTAQNLVDQSLQHAARKKHKLPGSDI